MNSQSPQRRQLGASGPVVFPLALGCMGMSDFYGPADEAESIATIHAALDAGSHCSTPATTMLPGTTSC
jgi:aryl-alcohol dehydrogenase-like predicted oxidoreductase